MRALAKSLILVSIIFSVQSCNLFDEKPADTAKDSATITTPAKEDSLGMQDKTTSPVVEDSTTQAPAMEEKK